MPLPHASPPSAERIVAKRAQGAGFQYQVKWSGSEVLTWEAASRLKRGLPALVETYEQQPRAEQQHQRTQPENKVGAIHEGRETARSLGNEGVAADGSSMRSQMEAMQTLLRAQAVQLQQLQATPEHSPRQSQNSSSRFARKEPRAQDLREYDGVAGTKLDEWLDELGAAVDLFHLNDREAVDFATSRLRGAARQWWNGLASEKTSIDGAGALSRALRARFQPVTTERVAREQLRVLHQGSRSINEYIAEFQRLRTLLPDMSEADALFAFESGASPAISLELRKQGSTRLMDAVALAARIGGVTAAAAASSMQGRSTTANQMEIDCSDSAMEERISRAVLNMMQSRQTQSTAGPKAQPQRGQNSMRGRAGGLRGPSARGGDAARIPKVPGVPAEVVEQRRAAGQCYRCGSKDHTRFDCVHASSSSN